MCPNFIATLQPDFQIIILDEKSEKLSFSSRLELTTKKKTGIYLLEISAKA